jgi:hypothetical protein
MKGFNPIAGSLPTEDMTPLQWLQAVGSSSSAWGAVSATLHDAALIELFP